MANPPELQLVATFPSGTSLDDYDIPRASREWIDMIDSAQKTLDIGQFYIISEPGRRMEPVLEAVMRAAERGVAVRVIVDKKFIGKYPQAVDRLRAVDGVDVGELDLAEMTGGILHAKYFIVDRRDAYIGSQNFDWRSLEHVAELGVRIRSQPLVDAICDVFDTDWGLSHGEEQGFRVNACAHQFPVKVQLAKDDEAVWCSPAFSPHGLLPDETLWDLPSMLTAIATAKRSVMVQVMSYATHVYGAQDWEVLDDALRAAAKRGAQVTMLVGDWVKKNSKKMRTLRSLNRAANMKVLVASIPEAAEGPIPFSRVIHSKFLVVDGEKSWIGTSNWSKDYFIHSRNLGLRVDGAAFAQQLERLFNHVAKSGYATEVVSPEFLSVPGRVERCVADDGLPVVVFDLDSALLSPGRRNLAILQEFAASRWLKGKQAYREFPEFVEDLKPEKIPSDPADLLRKQEWADEPFLEKWAQFWADRFFERKYLALDGPAEGVVDFARACHERGALLYYVSSRHYGSYDGGMESGTVEALIRADLPCAGGHVVLQLRPSSAIGDKDFKRDAMRRLRQLGGEVLATFQDDPASAEAFLQELPEAQHFWLQTIDSQPGQMPDRLIKIDSFYSG